MKNRSKRLPMRTCVACRQVKPKRELTRLVCTGQGRVEVDAGGKKEGRGAYLCRDPKCWEPGLKGNRLEHCLKTTISPENHGELERYFKEAIS
jgi:predicted RNA-binding protein YlxR (DUF448 family)